jgi:hypothetical protein
MNRLALPTQLVAPRRAYVFLATAALAMLVALTISVSTSRAAVIFDGSPGTGPPPATLGPYQITPFPNDPRAEFTVTNFAPGPTGLVLFNPLVQLLTVGSGWGTWSHGYTGDVYWTQGATALTMTLPTNTKAFRFYAEPDPFGFFNITATTNNGTTSGPIPVDGFAGAKYFGFFTTTLFESIASITVTSTVDFAVGEFGIFAGGRILPCPPYPQMGPCVVGPQF